MHRTSYQLMWKALGRYPAGRKAETLVLDIGSLDVNGSYRALIEDVFGRYVGLDIVPGRNVDVVAEQFDYPFADGAFDIVISGCTMEHVTAIWRWVPELVRVLKSEGLLAIVTHVQQREHRYPVDCWRVLPDGMRYLFDQAGSLKEYEIEVLDTDIVGSAFKEVTMGERSWIDREDVTCDAVFGTSICPLCGEPGYGYHKGTTGTEAHFFLPPNDGEAVVIEEIEQNEKRTFREVAM